MTTAEKAYIAGFLDADGSIYVRLKPNEDYRYNFQVAPYIVFYQKKNQVRVLEYIQNLLNIGYLRYRKDGIVEYTIGDVAGLRSLIAIVRDYLVLKRRRLCLLEEILSRKEDINSPEDFLALAKLIDKFEDLNYSQKRTVTSKKVALSLKEKGLL